MEQGKPIDIEDDNSQEHLTNSWRKIVDPTGTTISQVKR
jgi:hypothetical protein